VLDIHRRILRKNSPKAVCFKAIKWLLYRAWSKLSLTERRVLLAAFRQAPVLRKLYFLKNELRNIFEADLSRQEADTLLKDWLAEAKALADDSLNKFVGLVESWKKHILIFFTTRATNGLVEGINNGIKTLKRVAYGFRNFEQFRLRIIVNFLQPL
ncbi:MAG: transposase, partial [Rudanella sp.]|nr:transposase [Rudanella sp.]